MNYWGILPVILLGIISGGLISILAELLIARRQGGGMWVKPVLLSQAVSSAGRKWLCQTVILMSVMGGLGLLLSLTYEDLLMAGLAFLYAGYGVLVTTIDIRVHLIPWETSIFGAAIALALGVVSVGWAASILGGVSSLGVFLIIYWIAKKVRWGNKRLNGDPIGLGDVILVGITGLALGFPESYWALLIGSLAGGIGARLVWLIRRGRGEKLTYMPYAPALISGSLFVLFLGLFR